MIKDHEGGQSNAMTPCTSKTSCRFIQAYGKFSLELYAFWIKDGGQKSILCIKCKCLVLQLLITVAELGIILTIGIFLKLVSKWFESPYLWLHSFQNSFLTTWLIRSWESDHSYLMWLHIVCEVPVPFCTIQKNDA